jgi:hypothetical protein
VLVILATQGSTWPCPAGRPGTPIAENALHPPVALHGASPVETAAGTAGAPTVASAWSIVAAGVGSVAFHRHPEITRGRRHGQGDRTR